MDLDIQSQLNRARELLEDLSKSCENDLCSEYVSEKTKNLTQEVLVKVRQLLDQSMHRFFDKYYSINNTKYTKVYFPIVDDRSKLSSSLQRSGMTNTQTTHASFYQYLDSIQPYNSGFEWMKSLRDFSNEKHIRLTPQITRKENETTLGNAVRVGRGATTAMHGCFIEGVLVNSDNINEEPIENFDKRLNIKRTTWVSFLFSNTDINSLDLCAKSVSEIEKILENMNKFI